MNQDTKAKLHASKLPWIAATLGFVALLGYPGAYLTLVRVAPPTGQHELAAQYLWGGEVAESFFAPALECDRWLRSEKWSGCNSSGDAFSICTCLLDSLRPRGTAVGFTFQLTDEELPVSRRSGGSAGFEQGSIFFFLPGYTKEARYHSIAFITSEIAAKETVQTLIETLDDPHDFVRETAAKKFVYAGRHRRFAATSLVAKLSSEKVSNRATFTALDNLGANSKALEEIGGTVGIGAWNVTCANEQNPVRKAFQTALSNVRGRSQ